MSLTVGPRALNILSPIYGLCLQSSELLWQAWTKTCLGTWEAKWSAGPGAVHSCRGTQVGQGNWGTCYRWEEAQAVRNKDPDIPGSYQPLKTHLADIKYCISLLGRTKLCLPHVLTRISSQHWLNIHQVPGTIKGLDISHLILIFIDHLPCSMGEARASKTYSLPLI